jgi:hypothetical protein
MTNFKFDLDDLSDSSAITRKASQNFYPNGTPLTTSYSQDPDAASRTLTQRDLQGILGGDALYRSPNFALQISQKNTESSIGRILAASPGTDVAGEGIKIADPNSTNPNAYLTRIWSIYSDSS